MFGGNNTRPIENPIYYESNASTQLQLFGNITAPRNADQVINILNDNYNASALEVPLERGRGSEDVTRQNNLQISLNALSHDKADRSGVHNVNNVSTGLSPLYDDERHSSVTTANGSMSSLPLTMALLDDLSPEIERQNEEFDHYLRFQEDEFVKNVREMKQRHQASFANMVDLQISWKLRDKDKEIESINRRNLELADRIHQAASQAQAWQHRLQCNKSMVHALQGNLQLALAQGATLAGAIESREGYGDSEVDNAASSLDPSADDYCWWQKLITKMGCKSCKGREVRMLLLPCRHLCLCRECDAMVDACPVCFVRKTVSVEVHIP